MTSAVLLALFVLVAAYFIWQDRHDELWDRIVEVFGAERRSHRGSVARPIWLIDRATGKKMRLNGIHIHIDAAGIYLGRPVLLGYKGHAFLPWTATRSLPCGRGFLGRRARLLVSSLDIAVDLPWRYRSELERYC